MIDAKNFETSVTLKNGMVVTIRAVQTDGSSGRAVAR